MSVGKKIAGNTAIVLATRFINTGLGIATVYLLTRLLGPTDYGAYMTLLAYVAVASNVVEFGFRPILTREISAEREEVNVYVGNAMMVKLGLAVVAFTASNLCAYFLVQDPRLLRFMLLYSMSLFFLVVSVFESTFAAHLNVKVPSLLRTAQRTILLVLVFAVAYGGGSLVHIILAELLAGLFYILSGYLLSLKHLKPSFLYKKSLWRELIAVSWPLGAYLMLDQVLHKVDIIVLSSLEEQASVGIYSLAARLTQFLEVFAAAVMVSVFPLLCKYHKTDAERFEALWKLSFKYLMAFVVLICLVVSYMARPLVLAVGGLQFGEASAALQVLVWSQVFVYARAISANIFIAIKDQKLVWILNLVAVIANVGLDYLLIPRMGYMGACWGTLAAYSLIFPLAYALKEARPYMKGLLSSLLRPALGLMAAYATLLFIGQEGITEIIIAAAVYCCVLVVTKGITREDIWLIRGISPAQFNWRNINLS